MARGLIIFLSPLPVLDGSYHVRKRVLINIHFNSFPFRCSYFSHCQNYLTVSLSPNYDIILCLPNLIIIWVQLFQKIVFFHLSFSFQRFYNYIIPQFYINLNSYYIFLLFQKNTIYIVNRHIEY